MQFVRVLTPLVLAFASVSPTSAALVEWLDWTGLDPLQVASASGQDFIFDLRDGAPITVNVKQTLVGGGDIEFTSEPLDPFRSFITAYTPGSTAPIPSYDLPVNESIRYLWTAGGQFDTELTFTFSRAVELFAANSELTSNREQHVWSVLDGTGWEVADGPHAPQSISLSSTSFTNDTLQLLGGVQFNSRGYVVGRARQVTQFRWFLDDESEGATNAESIAIGVVVPEPSTLVLVVAMALIMVQKKRFC